jgi:hypothetical protein
VSEQSETIQVVIPPIGTPSGIKLKRGYKETEKA